MALRKVTFRLYPNVAQSERLVELLGLHQRLYNTALEERIKTYQDGGKPLSYNSQAKPVTGVVSSARRRSRNANIVVTVAQAVAVTKTQRE